MDNIKDLIAYLQDIKLLYVEDNPDVRKSTKIILDEFFGEVIIAVNGEDGLNKFKSNDIDMIITDINMPKMDGLVMVKHIKKINDVIPIAFFSSYNRSDYFIESIKLGVDGYLLKPIDINQFTSLLKTMVQKITLQSEAKTSKHLLQQYKEITDKSAIISVIDTHETITYVNDAFCKISEFTKDELIGSKYHKIFNYLKPKDIHDEIWSIVREKKQIWQGVTEYKSKSGKLYYLKNTIKPILDTNSEIIEYMAIRHDVTDIRLAAVEKEKYLILAKEQADAANDAKSEFLSSMSHEIRTPMNAILGMSHLALETELNPKQHHYIDKVHQSAELLLGIINDILDFSKIEAGKLDIENVSFNILEIMSNLQDIISLKAKEKDIKIKTFIPLNLPENLIGDPLRLKQILINLCDNAVKFSNKKSNIQLSIDIEEEDNQSVLLHFSIADTGIGISAEQQTRLFRAFSQADASTTREYGGTGLGLAISKKLIQMMQGKIWFDTELGQGSTFHITVRFEKQSENIHESITSIIENKDDAIKQLYGARILLVEDNLVNQEIALDLLQKNGLQVELADNGHNALAFLARQNFDGILMDCQMPVMDGYIATRKIRQLKQFKHLPIIAMTANAMKGDKEKALDAGMNDYISKPININNMFITMAEWIKSEHSQLISNKPATIEKADKKIIDKFINLTGIDVKTGLQLTEQNSQLYSKLLVLFQQSQYKFKIQFDRAKKDDDIKQMHYLSHSLKGAAGSIGAQNVQETALKLELACERGEVLDNTLLLAVNTELDIVLSSIKNFETNLL